MEQLNSGARPERLEQFAAKSEEIGRHLAAENHRLESVLLRFSERCTEYRVMGVQDVPVAINAIERDLNELAIRTRLVAHAFRNADIGALEGLREPPPAGGNPVVTSPLSTIADMVVISVAMMEGAKDYRQDMDTRTDAYGTFSRNVLRSTARDFLHGTIIPQEVAVRLVGLSVIMRDWVFFEIGEASSWIGWNLTAIYLEQVFEQIEYAAEDSGNTGLVLKSLEEFPGLLASVVAVAGFLTVFGVDEIWADIPGSEGNIPALLERSFWRQQHYIEPLIFQRLTKRMDRLISTSGVSNPRPLIGKGSEPLRDPERGVLEVRASQLFPPGADYTYGPYQISPGALMQNEHALISPYTGEQVSFARINHEEYVIGIYGLDMQNISGSPNGLHAVAQTAAGDDPELNPYYLTVRARVLDCIRAMPPGSKLHFTGHSMGGGMVITLLNDPLVLDAIRAQESRVLSAVTLGAVRPLNDARDEILNGGPQGAYADVLGDVVVRHYTDVDDQLAMNEGAGHDPARYPAVILLDDGELDGPTEAHTGYEYAPYEQLPPEFQTLPWTVDPEYVEKYRVPPPEWRRQLPEFSDAELVT